jgi:hypothetical protein
MSGACPRPLQLMSAAGSREAPVVALRGGRPGKNEQPRTNAGFTPSAIMSPGRSRPVHPDKAGRHRAPPHLTDRLDAEATAMN